jgi:hypothetical protein
MFEAENVRDWIGLPVVDFSGVKIGTLESIYFDTATDDAAFAAVHIGILGGQKLVFAPLKGAVVAPKHLKVLYSKKQVKESPFIGTDGELEAGLEPELYTHYELPYATGANGERRLGRR